MVEAISSFYVTHKNKIKEMALSQGAVSRTNTNTHIIDEKGNLTHFFESTFEPIGKEMRAALKI